MPEILTKPVLPESIPATEADVSAYLRYTQQWADIVVQAERDALVVQVCDQLEITVSDQALQAAGDAFRTEHQLFGASETLAWLAQQRVTAEDWSQGIRISLLTQKLKEHLFGEAVDQHYLNDRNAYRRVALSQILVLNREEADKILQALRAGEASFCALAMTHSRGKQSRENGGFVGIQFTSQLLPAVAQAVTNAEDGKLVGPVQTELGHHILKVEKWLPAQLKEARQAVLDLLFQNWLKATHKT